MTKRDSVVIAAWAATLFGLVEGAVLLISRAYPAVLAPYKMSVHALWIPPIVDVMPFLIVAPVLPTLLKAVRRWLKGSDLLAAYGVYSFLGFVTVLATTKTIHWVAVVVLPLGLAVTVCRMLRGSEMAGTDYLRRRLLWIPALILTAAVGAWGYEGAREQWLFRKLPTPPTSAMNVLVVVLDTVRYDSFTRPIDRSLTPNLDRLAATGTRFRNAWSTTSWSLPSQAAILTGRYPHEHGADWPRLELNKQWPTLPEYFAGRGYVTGAFSGNAAWVTPEYLGRGFLRFDVYLLEDLLRRTALGRVMSRVLSAFGLDPAGRGKKADVLNAQFLDFLDDYQARPFFAYLCYMDVNQAFHHRRLDHPFWVKNAPTREVIAAYEQGLTTLDAQVGRLFGDLERRGVLRNTLVIITSDHGESFGADGTTDHDPPGHGTSLYPEQTRVPMFVIAAGKVRPGQEVTQVVSTRAIPSMITHLLGLTGTPFHDAYVPDVLRPESEGEGRVPPALITLSYDYSRIRSVVWDRWQYLKVLTPAEREELYDLAIDPLATTNQAPAHPVMDPIRSMLQQALPGG
jgi:arylsulfatase A-like enzyme